MRMRTSIFKNPPPHPHTEWVGLLHTLPRTPPNLFLIDTASDSQPDRRKLIIVLISITVFFCSTEQKGMAAFQTIMDWSCYEIPQSLLFTTHSKSEFRDSNGTAKNLNFPHICPKMPRNGPKMTQNEPKWPKHDPKRPKMAQNGPKMTQNDPK